MPALFFVATDPPGQKAIGTANVYRRLSTFMRRNHIAISPGITDRDDIHAAIGELWDALGGDIPTLRADVTGPLNAQASDLEIAMLAFFVLTEKFTQFGATLPGGGGP